MIDKRTHWALQERRALRLVRGLTLQIHQQDQRATDRQVAFAAGRTRLGAEEQELELHRRALRRDALVALREMHEARRRGARGPALRRRAAAVSGDVRHLETRPWPGRPPQLLPHGWEPSEARPCGPCERRGWLAVTRDVDTLFERWPGLDAWLIPDEPTLAYRDEARCCPDCGGHGWRDDDPGLPL
jgi:hypothetical protein